MKDASCRGVSEDPGSSRKSKRKSSRLVQGPSRRGLKREEVLLGEERPSLFLSGAECRKAVTERDYRVERHVIGLV